MRAVRCGAVAASWPRRALSLAAFPIALPFLFARGLCRLFPLNPRILLLGRVGFGAGRLHDGCSIGVTCLGRGRGPRIGHGTLGLSGTRLSPRGVDRNGRRRCLLLNGGRGGLLDNVVDRAAVHTPGQQQEQHAPRSSHPTRLSPPVAALKPDHAERIAFGWDLLRAEAERLKRFAAEMTAIGAFAMAACGGATERSPSPAPCDPPAVVSSCFEPGGSVTRCPLSDGSFWDYQPSGAAVHWKYSSEDGVTPITLCTVGGGR